MGKLVYAAITSLDGYVADRDGNFDWCVPDAQVHAFVNERQREAGTYLFGRRMYEVMRVWEHPGQLPATEPQEREFAEIWGAADKVVYSRTLSGVSTARTRLERSFDPAAVGELKRDRDLLIGGPELAGQALAAGLVDEVQLYPNPVAVGGGKPALPTGVRLGLELLDHRRFDSGVVYLHYRVLENVDPE